MTEEEETAVAQGKKQKNDKGKKKAVVPKVVEESEDEEEDVSASEGEEEEFPEFAGFDQEELDEEDEEVEAEVESEPEFDGTSLLSTTLTADSELAEWSEIKLHNALKKALVALEFNKPTDIQTRSLPFALDGRDIVGVAETVSPISSVQEGKD